MFYLNMFLLSLIIIFIIDLSDFIYTVKKFLSKLLTGGKLATADYKMKPFDCSFCMIFWTGIIYMLIFASFSIVNLSYICLLSFLSVPIKEFILLIRDIITKIINKIYKIFNIC